MCHPHNLQQTPARQGQSSWWQLGAWMQQRLTPAPPDPSSSLSSSGHSCLHSGIYISAHPTKCNSCSGAFRIPRTHNRIGVAPTSLPGPSPSEEMELHVLSSFLGLS